MIKKKFTSSIRLCRGVTVSLLCGKIGIVNADLLLIVFEVFKYFFYQCNPRGNKV